MSIDEATDEPKLTLDRLVGDHGPGATLRALARVLHDQGKTKRTEGEVAAARVLRRAARTCLEQSIALEQEGA